MTPITAWHIATSHIERDVRLSELTEDEIASIVAAIREGQPMTKDDAIKAIDAERLTEENAFEADEAYNLALDHAIKAIRALPADTEKPCKNCGYVAKATG